MTGITADEYMAALIEAMRPTEAVEGWKTAEELALASRVSLRTMRKRLAELKAEGILLVQYVKREAIDGKLTRRPVYARKPSAGAN